MLHTWSLAIEEQFYLFWPLLVIGTALVLVRTRRAIIVLSAVGIAISVYLLARLWSPDMVDRAYMGTDARIFEPLIGALAAAVLTWTITRRWVQRFGPVLALVGAAGLVFCVAVIRPEDSFYFHGGAELCRWRRSRSSWRSGTSAAGSWAGRFRGVPWCCSG